MLALLPMHMIDLHDLTVRYPGASTEALKSVSLAIPPGEFVALMGGNGSGKSTLARSLNGLLRPATGDVTVDGFNTRDEGSCKCIRRRLGIVFQNPHMQTTSLTVEREIAFGLQNTLTGSEHIREIVDEQLAAAGLQHVRTRPPRTLSGGEQQRLALAAVLAMRPAHLVLDEATSLLSPASRLDLLRAVAGERRSRCMTVLLITQFAEEAMNAGRLVILRAGTILYDGDPAEVFARCAASGTPDIPVPLRFRTGFIR
jgi:energy-coupling factor transporter ATP-binding protein EcfA2